MIYALLFLAQAEVIGKNNGDLNQNVVPISVTAEDATINLTCQCVCKPAVCPEPEPCETPDELQWPVFITQWPKLSMRMFQWVQLNGGW